MGRAFSIHTFAGFLGGAVAPAIVARAGRHDRRPRRPDRGRRRSGRLSALLLLAVGIPDASAADRARRRRNDAAQPNVVTPAIIVLDRLLHAAQPFQRRDRQFRRGRADRAAMAASFSTANIALTAFLGC